MDQRFTESSTVVGRKQLLTTEVDEEAVMLDPEAGLYYGLNEVGTLVWSLLEEPKSIAELKAAVLAEFDISADQCQQDLAEFLTDCYEADLIEIHDDATR